MGDVGSGRTGERRLLVSSLLAAVAGRAHRWPTLIIGSLLILLVGPSRVYLAAHWPSDVVAGYVLGYSIWALAVFYQA